MQFHMFAFRIPPISESPSYNEILYRVPPSSFGSLVAQYPPSHENMTKKHVVSRLITIARTILTSPKVHVPLSMNAALNMMPKPRRYYLYQICYLDPSLKEFIEIGIDMTTTVPTMIPAKSSSTVITAVSNLDGTSCDDLSTVAEEKLSSPSAIGDEAMDVNDSMSLEFQQDESITVEMIDDEHQSPPSPSGVTKISIASSDHLCTATSPISTKVTVPKTSGYHQRLWTIDL